MIDRSKGTGRVVFMVAPGGSVPVRLDGFNGAFFEVSTHGQKSRRSQRIVLGADLFETKDEPLAEFRKRRDGAR